MGKAVIELTSNILTDDELKNLARSLEDQWNEMCDEALYEWADDGDPVAAKAVNDNSLSFDIK